MIFFKKCKLNEKIYIILTSFIVILTSVIFCHGDSYDAIIPWGLDFIRTLKSGTFMNYYYQVNGIGMYNILIILISAIWQLPVFLISKLFSFNSLVVYIIWWKIFLLIMLALNSSVLVRIFDKCNYSFSKKYIGLLVYISSPIVLWGNIAMGQVDIVSSFFLLLALYYYYFEQFDKMCFFASIAITFKSIPIIIIIPLILFTTKDIAKIIRYFIELLGFPFIVESCSRCIGGYNDTKNTFGLDRIFENNYNYANILIMSLIVLFSVSYFCGYINNEKRTGIFFSVISFCSFLINVAFHPQWVIYLIPVLIILAMDIEDNLLYFGLSFVMNIGYILFVISLWEYKVDNYMINHGILPYIFHYDYNGKTIWQTLLIDMSFGKALFIGGVLSIAIISFVCPKCVRQKNTQNSYWYYMLQISPSLSILLYSVLLYILQ